MKQVLNYVVFALLLIFFVSCSEKIEPGTTESSHPVIKGLSVATAHITDQPRFYDAVGTVRAGISSDLASKLLGAVREVKVREGDRVKKGDVLVVIDQRQVKADVRKAEAGLSAAKKTLVSVTSTRDVAGAEEKLALATYKRYRKLKEKNMVSLQVFEEMETRYSKAKAGLARAKAVVAATKARVRQAEAALAAVGVSEKDAVITAPHNGIITGKLVDKGDLASPGTPLLTLETTRGFCVDMVLPETYIEHVRPRQKVFISVPALKTGLLEGSVCTIVPSSDPQSRSFIVKINLPIDRSVRSGMFARVRIPTGVARKLTINRKSVVSRGQLTGIYLLDSSDIAHFRLIRLGKVFGEGVEVLSGLKEGDRYIKDPPPVMSDGARVVS